jgi:hypothetical protein
VSEAESDEKKVESEAPELAVLPEETSVKDACDVGELDHMEVTNFQRKHFCRNFILMTFV